MIFEYTNNGHSRRVAVRVHQNGSAWSARAVLLPQRPDEPEEALTRGPTRLPLEFHSPTEREAIDRIAFVLEKVYCCTRRE